MILSSKTTYRVIYGDTDQMGVVYYGTYPRFYEIGRAEMIRELGYSYKQLEATGIFMPVASIQSKYHFPIYYDELISIKTTINDIPKARMVFHHEIFNEEGKHVHSADVTLVFLNEKTNRPVRAPQELISVLEKMTKENI